jgi:hypothetical protein
MSQIIAAKNEKGMRENLVDIEDVPNAAEAAVQR